MMLAQLVRRHCRRDSPPIDKAVPTVARIVPHRPTSPVSALACSSYAGLIKVGMYLDRQVFRKGIHRN